MIGPFRVALRQEPGPSFQRLPACVFLCTRSHSAPLFRCGNLFCQQLSRGRGPSGRGPSVRRVRITSFPLRLRDLHRLAAEASFFHDFLFPHQILQNFFFERAGRGLFSFLDASVGARTMAAAPLPQKCPPAHLASSASFFLSCAGDPETRVDGVARPRRRHRREAIDTGAAPSSSRRLLHLLLLLGAGAISSSSSESNPKSAAALATSFSASRPTPRPGTTARPARAHPTDLHSVLVRRGVLEVVVAIVLRRVALELLPRALLGVLGRRASDAASRRQAGASPLDAFLLLLLLALFDALLAAFASFWSSSKPSPSPRTCAAHFSRRGPDGPNDGHGGVDGVKAFTRRDARGPDSSSSKSESNTSRLLHAPTPPNRSTRHRPSRPSRSRLYPHPRWQLVFPSPV